MIPPKASIKIPRERIGVLIGQNGMVKEHIERALLVKLKVDSATGDIDIELALNADDPSKVLEAKELIMAIGNGFSPERAFRLLRDENAILDIIDLRRICGRLESHIKRLKGRVIGKNGKARKMIEELTNTYISVYGDAISIIGDVEEARIAREAIQMLIQGSMHSTVYRFLHKKRRELKKKAIELWEEKN